MKRTEKIIIFNGPKEKFDVYVNDYYKKGGNNYNLTKLVNLSEQERNTFKVEVQGQKKEEQSEKTQEKPKDIDLLTVSMNEYSGVTEAVINNFVNFVSKYNIKKIIIQNPPTEIVNDLNRQYDKANIHIHNHNYGIINNESIKRFKEISKNSILGQEIALEKVTQSLIIQQKLNKEYKPIVIMLYGPSGVGKTETGRLLANILGEKMFYNQFSMFQNEGHMNYLYGDKVQMPSFAKDLMNRTSNIIFLDEFDKANRFVYSALYNLFDTGEYEDNNFHVDLKNTLIICTSNYENQEKILEHLGEPMFYRINSFIKYNYLSTEVKIKLIEKYYSEIISELHGKERKIIEASNIKETYVRNANKFNNARQISNFLRNEIAKELVKNID